MEGFVFGILLTLFIFTVAALLIALIRKEPAPVVIDLELRIAAAEVRERLEEMEKRTVNANGTVIVRWADLRWMREKLFEAAIGK